MHSTQETVTPLAHTAIDRLARDGRMRRSGNGVVLAAAWPASLEHKMAAARAITAGVVCFRTAGFVWELRKSPNTPEVHIGDRRNRRVKASPDVHVHLTGHLLETDIVRRRDGIVVTSRMARHELSSRELDRELGRARI